MYRDLIAEEDAWWDARCERQIEAEAEAETYANASAKLYEFDSDEEREAYIIEVYEERLAELLSA